MIDPESILHLDGMASLLRLGIESEPQMNAPKQHPALDEASTAGYRILTLVARGGFGQVWRAIQLKAQRDAAIKCINVPSALPVNELVDMLAEEGRILADLNDPRFPRFLEADGEGESYFLAMEYIDGDPISDYCNIVQSDLESRLDLIEALIEATSILHTKEIVHGDIKPSNVLMRDDVTPVLVDFGMSVYFRREQSRLVPPRRIGGTPAYMAPELLDKTATSLNPTADVFSLCVLALELLDSNPSPHGVTSHVRRSVARGLTADPAIRTPDANALLEDFRRARRHVAIHHRRPIQVAAASVIMLSGAAALFVNPGLQHGINPQDTPGRNPNFVELSPTLHDETVKLLRNGGSKAAKRQLNQVTHDQRGWEWDYLDQWATNESPPISDRPLGQPHTYDASWSTDSGALAYSTAEFEVFVLPPDASERRLVAKLPMSPQFVAVDNHAKHILASTSEGIMFHCQLVGTDTISQAVPLDHPVRKACLNDAGESLAAWVLTKNPSSIEQLEWNARTASWLVLETRPCLDAVFGIDQNYPVLIIGGGQDKRTAKLLDLDGKAELRADLPEQIQPMSYAYDPHRQALYAGDYYGSIWRYEDATGWVKFLQVPTEQPVLSLDISPEDDRLYVAAEDAYVVDSVSGRILLRLNDEDRTNIILKIRWNPDTQTLHALTSDHARTWGQARRVVLR